MRRPQRLSRRLLAVIAAISLVLLAILAMLLVTIRELRSADRTARNAGLTMLAAREVQSALAELEAAERGVAISGAPLARRWRRAADAVLATTAKLERTTAPSTSAREHALAAAASARTYLADSSEPLVALARRDPAEARRWIAARANEPGDAAIQAQLMELIETQAATRERERQLAGSRAMLAEVVGVVGLLVTIALALLLVAYIRRAVLKPIDEIADAARALAAGDLGARVSGRRGPGEIAELADTFDRMATSLQESRDALERRNGELATQSMELVDTVRSARESASVLRAVLDATPDAIALLDARGETLVDNPPMRSVRATFGPGELAVDRHGALVPLDQPNPQSDSRDEITLLGSHRAFARYAAPVHDSGGRVIGHLLVLREITREREAERAKEEFFALISHELRTPLTAILGYVELVLADEDGLAIDDEHRRHLEIVDRNAQRLLRLVGDLLFAAQVEAGTLLLEPGAVDLPQLVRDAVETAQPRAEEAGVSLDAQIASLPRCLGDRDRLAQVLDNLVMNALKFTPPGGRVAVRLWEDDDRTVRLEVSDSGVGIPADELPRLFDRFYRATNATARAVPGLGLGLMIVRAIVEAHDGTVTVTSEVGTGTTFGVTLPLRAAPDDERVALTAGHGRASLRRYSAGGR